MDINKVIEGCLNGDKISQSEIYRSYNKFAYNIIKRYVNNDMDVEDILQNGFVKLYRCIHQYDGKGKFENWLYSIFKNMSIDFLRKKKYSLEYCDNLDITVVEDVDYREDKLTDIESLLNNLSKSYRTAITMYYYENLQHKEIAERLNINEGTSKSNLHKAKQKLIKELKNKIYES